jgi:hypothetical protein
LEAHLVTTQHGSFLATRRGGLTLLLLCAVQFLDVADSSIMNVALPSIRPRPDFRGGTDRLKAVSTPAGRGRTPPAHHQASLGTGPWRMP